MKREESRFFIAIEKEVIPTKEYIRVLVRFVEGKTVCICMRDNPRCKRRCTPDIVERDKMRDWQETFKVNKYGK